MKEKKQKVLRKKAKAVEPSREPQTLAQAISQAHEHRVLETTDHALLPIKSYVVENMNKIIPKLEKQIMKLEKSIEDHNYELDLKKEKLMKLRMDLSHLAYIRNNTHQLNI
jgi:prefoldin subunit 5